MITLPRLGLFLLTLAACDKSQPTETPTTANPATGAEPVDPTAGGSGGECRPTGCSGTVCSDEDQITTCEYRPEFACYKTATCARQADGACGWTKSDELDACLANPPAE
jgi:hypothetical protein